MTHSMTIFNSTVRYTGAPDAVCPITFAPLSELHRPVAFHRTPHVAYECSELVKWLSRRSIEPFTNLPVKWKHSPLEVIAPLADHCPNPVEVAMFIESELKPANRGRVYFLLQAGSVLFSVSCVC